MSRSDLAVLLHGVRAPDLGVQVLLLGVRVLLLGVRDLLLGVRRERRERKSYCSDQGCRSFARARGALAAKLELR